MKKTDKLRRLAKLIVIGLLLSISVSAISRTGWGNKAAEAFAVEGSSDIYTQNFDNSPADWTCYSVTSNKNWHLSTSADKNGGRNSTVGYVINNYSGDTDSEDWLISPLLNTSNAVNASISYWMESTYSGSTINVVYSTDYDGKSNPKTATWTVLFTQSLTKATPWAQKQLNLPALSKDVYIAFKHTSGKTSGKASSISIDDFVFSGELTNITGAIHLSQQTPVQFTYTEKGSKSPSVSYTLRGENLTENITVSTSAPFELSLNETEWSSGLVIDKNKTENTTVFVRFSPVESYSKGYRGQITHASKGALNQILNIETADNPNKFDASQLGFDKTLDIVSWNMEWFGYPKNSKHAKTFEAQMAGAVQKINEMNADIYALQEVIIDDVNGNNLDLLLKELNKTEDKWDAVYGERFSHDDVPNFTEFPAQRVCFVYNKKTVEKITAESMFNNLYPMKRPASIEGYTGDAASFWASGRLPFRMKAKVTVDGVAQEINVVNIHAKCCQGGGSRRAEDAKFLKNKLDELFEGENVVILGDYNDFYPGSMDGGESPYASFYADNEKKFRHALGSTSKIDHITISDELYDEYDVLTNNTTIGATTISDHAPIMIRLKYASTAPSVVITEAENLMFDYIDVSAGIKPSAPKSYKLSGKNLTSDINIDVAAPFELSVDGNEWKNSITIAKSNTGVVEIKVRFNPQTAYSNAVEAVIKHESAGAQTVNIKVKASGFDNVAPVFLTGYPTISNVGNQQITITAKMNEPAKIYYVVMADNAVRPTPAQIMEGKNAVAAGFFVFNNSEAFASITNLVQNTPYDIYLTAEDLNMPKPNKMSESVMLEVRTVNRIPLPSEYILTAKNGVHYKSIDIPKDYYQTASNKKGTELKTELKKITDKGFRSYPYEEAGRGDVPIATRRMTTGTAPLDIYDVMDEADEDPNNAQNIYTAYKEAVYPKNSKHLGLSGSLQVWNREHVYPQSLGKFTDARAPWGKGTYSNGNIIENASDDIAFAQSDGHHLKSEERLENSKRNNFPFGASTTKSTYCPPLSARGDVARIIFYLNLRYNLNIGTVADQKMLLEWNEADPVDPFEVRHNNVIYKYQNNRNPFVDFPELVQYVYGSKASETWNPTMGTDQVSATDEVWFYPNPARDYLMVGEKYYRSTATVMNVTGQTVLVKKAAENSIDITKLERGIYFIKIENRVAKFIKE